MTSGACSKALFYSTTDRFSMTQQTTAIVPMHMSFIRLNVIAMCLPVASGVPHSHSSSNMSIQISLSFIARNQKPVHTAHLLEVSCRSSQSRARRHEKYPSPSRSLSRATHPQLSDGRPLSLARLSIERLPIEGVKIHYMELDVCCLKTGTAVASTTGFSLAISPEP